MKIGVTGANGYLGRVVSAQLRARGHETVALTRKPVDNGDWRAFDLSGPQNESLCDGLDAVIHGAWALGNLDDRASWETNVVGSRRLVEFAKARSLSSFVFVSSMSAWMGTRQAYGMMKLAVERTTLDAGYAVVRPGLVYGRGDAGGMAGTLAGIAKLPVWPRFAGAHLYLVRENDLARGLAEVALQPDLFGGRIVALAHGDAVPLGDLLEHFCSRRRPQIPMPAGPIMAAIKAVSAVGVKLPFRSDSLLGLVEPAPAPVGADLLAAAGLTLVPLGAAATATGGPLTAPESRAARDIEIAVVICVFTQLRWSQILEAAESVLRQTKPATELIFVVDNNQALHDELVAWVNKARGRTTVPLTVLNHLGEGHVAVARTMGVAHATSDVVAFLDDDAVAADDWLATFAAVYRDTRVTAVGGAPLPDYEAPRPRWLPEQCNWVFGCAYDGLPTTLGETRRLIGANFSVDRARFKAIAPLRADGHEDLETCQKFAVHFPDARILFEPRAVVYHKVSAERLTWSYFWRRCYLVNRNKAATMRNIGAAANMKADRSFVLRSLLRTGLGGLRDLVRGDVFGPVRFVTLVLCVSLSAYGYLEGVVRLAVSREAARLLRESAQVTSKIELRH